MTPLPRITLVLGGTRSGKSKFAEDLFTPFTEKTYLATAVAQDEEMRVRIEQHRSNRGNDWLTIEEPFDIVGIIMAEGKKSRPLLIDCLTLWATNFFTAGFDSKKEVNRLSDALNKTSGPVVMVSNEIGLGVIPENRMARTFADLQGHINQLAAEASEQVIFVAAGLPIVMKNQRKPKL